MSQNKIRSFLYLYAIAISAFFAAIIVILTYLLSSIPEVLTDKPSLIMISVTLAGFLFTGQGIMLTLPHNNRFIQLIREQGYLMDFHLLCRCAELVFIASTFLGLDIFSNLYHEPVLVNMLYLFSFMWPLIMTIWALWIFGNVIGGLK